MTHPLPPPSTGPAPTDTAAPGTPLIATRLPVGSPPPRPLGRWRWWFAALTAVLIAVSVAVDAGALIVVPLLFVLVVPFEKLFPRHRGQRLRRPGVRTDLAYAAAAPALGAVSVAVGIVVAFASLAWIPGLAARPLVAMLPGAIVPFVGIAAFDLVIYWAHRLSHEVPFLWRFHQVHHSPAQMDWISGFRNHPFDGAIAAPAVAFLLAAGFDPAFTGALAVVQFVLGIFLHANVRWRWRWLDGIVVTPEFHHWHHANEPAAHNSNHSVFLPLWDVVFGTYHLPKDRRPSVYGIDEEMPPHLAQQLVQPFRVAP